MDVGGGVREGCVCVCVSSTSRYCTDLAVMNCLMCPILACVTSIPDCASALPLPPSSISTPLYQSLFHLPQTGEESYWSRCKRSQTSAQLSPASSPPSSRAQAPPPHATRSTPSAHATHPTATHSSPTRCSCPAPCACPTPREATHPSNA